MAVDNRSEMTSAVNSTWNVRDIHCPPLIAALCTAPQSVDPRPWRQRTLMDEPSLERQQSIHCLTVHADPFDETQPRPEAPITKGRMPLVRSILELIWKDRADSIEHEACNSVCVKRLRAYFRKPRKVVSGLTTFPLFQEPCNADLLVTSIVKQELRLLGFTTTASTKTYFSKH
jgi:hypothetical protein